MQIPGSPATVWGFLHDANIRQQGMNAKGVNLKFGGNGRIGPGSIYHCDHGGESNTDFTIVDWQPIDYSTEQVSGMPLNMVGKYTIRLIPTEQGTHVTFTGEYPTLPSGILNLPARLMAMIAPKLIEKSYLRVLELVNEAVLKETSPQE